MPTAPARPKRYTLTVEIDHNLSPHAFEAIAIGSTRHNGTPYRIKANVVGAVVQYSTDRSTDMTALAIAKMEHKINYLSKMLIGHANWCQCHECAGNGRTAYRETCDQCAGTGVTLT